MSIYESVYCLLPWHFLKFDNKYLYHFSYTSQSSEIAAELNASSKHSSMLKQKIGQ